MEIIFLGTSSGTPTKTRNVSGIAIKKANSKSWYLIDCGEATQHQIQKTNLSLNNLQAICLTHVHGDHCYGLPGLLASASMAGRTKSLTIIAPRPIKKYFEIIQETTQLRLTYDINFIDPDDNSGGFQTREFAIDGVELSHRVPSFAYIFSEKDVPRKLNIPKLKQDGIESGPAWGVIQKGGDATLPDGRVIRSVDYLLDTRKPRKIIVCGDNDNPSLLAASMPADVLIHEATYTQDVLDKVGKGPQHSSAKMLAQFAQSTSIRNLILTHFSPRYQDSSKDSPSIIDIEKEAKEHYDGYLFLANDLDIYRLSPEGELVKYRPN